MRSPRAAIWRRPAATPIREPVAWPLWLFAEIAIIATDIAEVIGTAIGLNLLFGIPLEIGVIITALDVFLILWLQSLGFRWIEAFIITLLGVIAVCFAVQIALADPEWGARDPRLRADDRDRHQSGDAVSGARHHRRHRHAAQSLPAFGHRADPRLSAQTLPEKREALKFATIDSTVALMFALLINASILILAAATFYKAGKTEVAELGEAQSLLAPAARLGDRADAVRHRAAVLRPEFDRHGDAGRPERDGRLPRTSACRRGCAGS